MQLEINLKFNLWHATEKLKWFLYSKIASMSSNMTTNTGLPSNFQKKSNQIKYLAFRSKSSCTNFCKNMWFLITTFYVFGKFYQDVEICGSQCRADKNST